MGGKGERAVCGIHADEVGSDAAFGEELDDVELVLGDFRNGDAAEVNVRALDNGFAQVGQAAAHHFAVVADGFQLDGGTEGGDSLDFRVGVAFMDFFKQGERAGIRAGRKGGADWHEFGAGEMVGFDRLADGFEFFGEDRSGDASVGGGEKLWCGAQKPCGGFDRRFLVQRLADCSPHFFDVGGQIRAGGRGFGPGFGRGGDPHFQRPRVHGKLMGFLDPLGIGGGRIHKGCQQEKGEDAAVHERKIVAGKPMEKLEKLR